MMDYIKRRFSTDESTQLIEPQSKLLLVIDTQQIDW